MGEKKDDIIYCDWCGEFPYYISIYEDNDSDEETLLCKECFNKFEAEQEDYY